MTMPERFPPDVPGAEVEAAFAATPGNFYLYAEPKTWPKDGRPVEEDQKAQHRREINAFAAAVAGDEVSFVACSYTTLFLIWASSENPRIQAHAHRAIERYVP